MLLMASWVMRTKYTNDTNPMRVAGSSDFLHFYNENRTLLHIIISAAVIILVVFKAPDDMMVVL